MWICWEIDVVGVWSIVVGGFKWMVVIELIV